MPETNPPATVNRYTGTRTIAAAIPATAEPGCAVPGQRRHSATHIHQPSHGRRHSTEGVTRVTIHLAQGPSPLSYQAIA